jgi:SAM-dependent methyltransferase
MAQLLPTAVAEDRLETMQVDLLSPPETLCRRRFDLVFSFGVLHHTGDTRRALANLAPLVDTDGALFLYLYGSLSLDWPRRLLLRGVRAAIAPLPLALKPRALRLLLPSRDLHQAFDTFAPWINDTYRHETVATWLRELGFDHVVRTIDYTDLFLRARRPGAAAIPERPPVTRPYWFERFRRRPLPSWSAPQSSS